MSEKRLITETIYGINYTWRYDDIAQTFNLRTPNIDAYIYEVGGNWEYHVYSYEPVTIRVLTGKDWNRDVAIEQAVQFLHTLTEEQILWEARKP